MKRKDVEIGAVYIANVSGNRVRVRVLRESQYGKGFVAKNLTTGREIHCKSAQRLRYKDADQS